MLPSLRLTYRPEKCDGPSNDGVVTGGHSGDARSMLTNCATITRVSVDSVGNEANGNTGGQIPMGVYVGDAWVSRDGRYIAFPSEASNLIDADTNGL